MKRHLLVSLIMLWGGTLCSSAIDWESLRSPLDSMVNAKIVKWSQTVAADTMPMQYKCMANSYGSSFKPNYSTGGYGAYGGSGGKGGKGSTFDPSILFGGGEANISDTLLITRQDDDREQFVTEGTAYFKGPVNANQQLLKDSIFVTRLTHYLYVKGSYPATEVMKISVKDAGTLKVYAVSTAKYGGRISLYDDSHHIEYNGELWTTALDQATVDWNNFGDQVTNYNLSNPSANKTMSYSNKGGSTTEPKDTTLSCYNIFYANVQQGEYYLSFAQDTKVYGIELVRSGSRQGIINFPDNGLENLELENVDIDFVKLEAGNRSYTALVFGDNNAYIHLVPTDGGFKKGDVVSIAGACRKDYGEKAMLCIYSDARSNNVLYTTEQLVNGKDDPSPPKVGQYVLMQDMDYLIVRPYYRSETAIYLTKLMVTRARETEQTYREGPKIVSKVVRWQDKASAGKLADSYTSVDNPYAPPATFIASILNRNKSGASSDTLKLIRTDDDKVQSLVKDTVYFRSSVDPCSNHYRDSIYVTRFTHYLNTAAPSGDRNVLKLKLQTEGTLKIYARPTDGDAADRTILVTQGDREVINASLAADGDKAVVNVNTAAFSSVNNYNLANPPKVVNYNIGGQGDNTPTDTPTDVDVYPVLYARVDAGDLTIEYPAGAVEIYGVELVIIDQSGLKALIDYPDDSSDGLERSVYVKTETVTLKNGQTKSVYRFSDNYIMQNVTLMVDGGFKRGDIVKIGGFISESNNRKTGKLMLYYYSGNRDPAVLIMSDPLVNVMTDDNGEFIETVTLTDDFPALWIARSLDTTIPCYLSCVKVLGNRDNEEMARIRAVQRADKLRNDGDSTTGIEPLTIRKAQTEAPLYNLAGQRVGIDYKGIVIQNGHKFIRN